MVERIGLKRWVWKILCTEAGFPRGTRGKEPPARAGGVRHAGLIPGLGRSPGGGHGSPLQDSCLKNPHGQRSLAGYSPWGCRLGHHDGSDLASIYRDGS